MAMVGPNCVSASCATAFKSSIRTNCKYQAKGVNICPPETTSNFTGHFNQVKCPVVRCWPSTYHGGLMKLALYLDLESKNLRVDLKFLLPVY